MAARHSLRLRLPLLISTLLVVVVAAFLWATYREVEATLVGAGGDRAKGAADQVANLIGRGPQAGIENLRRVAADADLRRYLRNPTDATRDAALARLASLASASVRGIELWDAGGSRLLDVPIPVAVSKATPVVLPKTTRPFATGVNALQAVDHVVFADSTAEIREEASSAGQSSTSAVLGYLVVRGTLSVNPPGILGHLVGGDAGIKIGNTTGGTWTDLSSIVTAPAVDVTRNGTAEYRAANGDRRLGAISAVRGTPWVVWVEFPRSIIVAPARVFLGRMIGLALIFVAIGALLVGRLSVGITTPLHELAQAADKIAAGDYSRRVTADRADEIGQLGRAFNAMAAEVKTAVDALRSGRQTFAATLASIHDGVAVADAGGTLIYLNPMAERILGPGLKGKGPEELAQRGVYLPDGHTPVPADQRPLARALNGEDVSEVELFVRNGDFPSGAHINVNAGPLRDSDGTSHGAWVTFRDVSLTRRLEEERVRAGELERRGREAQQANRLKSDFLANMSHELRTPLNAIIGFTDLMHKGKAGPVSAQHEEYLGDVLSSSKHLLQLINDVLDLAKVESGKMDFRPERVDLATLVNEVSDVLRGLATSKGLRIETEVDPAVTAVVVDPARVKQILYNYLSNAIKFTPEGGRAQVRITPDGSDAFRIDVTDTGVGISPEDLGKLFVEFQQLDNTSSKKYQGTGLGLALTKRLVEAHGGHVAVRSSVGLGSTFSAILPRRMAVAAADHVGPVVGLLPHGNRTILVVDDDPKTVKLAEAVLREAGYSPVSSAKAEDALSIAQANPPAVVIVDLLMPGVDGFEFITRLRATPAGRHVPIIVWTIKDLDAVERRRLQLSAVTIVSKRSGGPHTLVEELCRIAPAMPLVLEGTHGP